LPKIGIVGLGYVGLCTGVCFAEKGLDVVGIDVSQERVQLLSRGDVPIFEKRLKEYLGKAIFQKTISFSTEYKALAKADYVFVTVGTPSLANGRIDLTQVRAAARSIGSLLSGVSGYPLVVVKSTVLPGTSRNVVRPLLEKLSGKRSGADFGLCSNPEFLREGSAIEDTLDPDKVVIGADDARSRQKLSELYTQFYGLARPAVVHTDLSTAELVKYANNAFLAMKISYINSIARICERLEDSDVKKVATAIGLDTRIGGKFLEAGPGYGGSCFPKDLSALISLSKKLRVKSSLFEAVERVNDTQPDQVIRLAKKLLPNLRGKLVSVLGLSFKGNTDDIREAPSLKVIRKLLSLHAKISVYDPKAMENVKRVLNQKVTYSQSAEDCIRGSDLCIVLTGWDDFSRLTPEDFVRLMARPRLLDGRRIYNPEHFASMPFAAIGLGS
jgi:UDPglucose 6-dehydrogenase